MRVKIDRYFSPPGVPVGHTVFDTAETRLLVPDIHNTSAAQATAECRTHRLLVHNDRYRHKEATVRSKNRQS